ncbi:glycosyltransferase [Oryzisolibacter sp. LB2S]|uniref:glycosyltransferase n=1 Tax=Alicycliphilus soli TaxID=3228789 RepID=UPI00345ADADA
MISVVSHGHADLVHELLRSLADLGAGTVDRVVLTLNLPESEPQAPRRGWPFVLNVRANASPLGFGTNHNRALRGVTEPFVCVLNPDIGLCDSAALGELVRAASLPGVGCAYPLQVDERGEVQDSVRALPTPWTLWRRRLLRRAEHDVDWVNAACMVLPRAVWETVGGFDESYHMYCEDVDLCLRIQLAGFRLQRADCVVVHEGARASSRKLDHLRWHMASMLRLWASPVYRQYKAARRVSA